MPIDTKFYEAWFDGSTRVDSQRSGVGGYILAPDGSVLTEYSLPIPYVECPFMLEYNAIIHTMYRLHEHGARNVFIYGDCKWVLEKLQKKTTKHLRIVDREMKLLHTEALELLRDFAYARVIYKPRQSNQKAHDLCRLATRGDLNGKSSDTDNGQAATNDIADRKEPAWS